MHSIDCRILCAAVLVSVAAGCSLETGRPPGYRLRIAATVPENDSQSTILKMFQSRVERATQHRVQVQLYFSGVLGSDTEILQKTQMGIIQGCNISTSNAVLQKYITGVMMQILSRIGLTKHLKGVI